ncbi:MAG: DUF4252 domain-containing protein [Halieaceae bacterium]|nr:DUF4252 domain-containing protein [Halieaceae bacterium]
MSRGLGVITAILLSVFVSACGVTASTQNPGFADIEIPRGAGLHRDTNISIGPRLLALAARHANEGPEARALLESIDGVRVRVYRIEPDSRKAWLHDALERSAEKLREQNWTPVIRVREPASTVHMLIREDSDRLLGLALMSVDDEELIVLNVMGRLAPDMLDGLADIVDEAAAREG